VDIGVVFGADAYQDCIRQGLVALTALPSPLRALLPRARTHSRPKSARSCPARLATRSESPLNEDFLPGFPTTAARAGAGPTIVQAPVLLMVGAPAFEHALPPRIVHRKQQFRTRHLEDQDRLIVFAVSYRPRQVEPGLDGCARRRVPLLRVFALHPAVRTFVTMTTASVRQVVCGGVRPRLDMHRSGRSVSTTCSSD
jgi:hypothetical protein